MAYLSVPTFTILRNTQTIIAVGMSYVLHREITSADSIMFLMAVLAGTVLYCWSDVNFHAVGYAWALVHVMSMSLYAVLVKKVGVNLDLTAREMFFLNK